MGAECTTESEKGSNLFNFGINPHWWKIVSMQEAQKARIEVKLHSLVMDADRDDSGSIVASGF